MLHCLWTVDSVAYPPHSIGLDWQGNLPTHAAWYCGICGDVWARRVVLDLPTTIDPAWRFWQIPCRRCAATRNCFQLPGSLMHYSDRQLLNSLPHDLLVREFLLLTLPETPHATSVIPTA